MNTDVDVPADLIPRNYQVHLMNTALKQNTIIFLPTGSGKTFIAVLVLKQLSASLQRSYNEGGKLSIVLVNTVALVDQQAKVLKLRTPFKVGAYSGELCTDNWTREQWLVQFNTFQILVMTSQILVNLINSNYIDLDKVNLLVFDECHHGVKDQPMRQIMRNFQNCTEPPRVLGLTATLLNGNCNPHDVMAEVEQLEVTYHSKVAAAEELSQIIGFATNPREILKPYREHISSEIENYAIALLEEAEEMLTKTSLTINRHPTTKNILNLKPLAGDDGLKDLRNLIKDAIFHIRMLGIFGGFKAMMVYVIQLERLKLHCDDKQMYCIFSSVLSLLVQIKSVFQTQMKHFEPKDQIMRFSSDKLYVLIDILREYKTISKQDLCAIIFVERRFTAKILYHILKTLAEIDEFSFIKPNFIVGYNNNPYNSTREGMYVAKQNKKVYTSFYEKECNLLVASNVLEEGIDMPNCSLVVKFDKPSNYRSYVQSKGRARHRDSFYYIMVSAEDIGKFQRNYITYQQVENILNRFLVGQNDERENPSEELIKEMYKEYPPYYVDGPGSAKVDLVSAISLLCRYCQNLPGDKYTVYTPEWYEEERPFDGKKRVVIFLPVISAIKGPIKGPFTTNIKIGKRAAALTACITLHKCGELDDNLLPKKRAMEDARTEHLFAHWPETKEKDAGTNKMKRTHIKKIPDVCRGQIKPLTTAYVHTINFTTKFSDINLATRTLWDMYENDLCFGIVTAKPLPELCEFPVYVTMGEINVSLGVNRNTVELNQDQIVGLREFHTLVFSDLLKLVKTFVIFDNNDGCEMTILVPLKKSSGCIDFDVVDRYKTLNTVMEPSEAERRNLIVEEENYLHKIVIPWYRSVETNYVVIRVCEELSSRSHFPSEDFDSYESYFAEKYRQQILSPDAPLLLVKALSKRLNCVKPRGSGGKRKRDRVNEEMEEHLIAELCVRQEFPAALWVQATLLPTVLNHVVNLLNAEQLRRAIASEAGLGCVSLPNDKGWLPLELDPHLLKYEPVQAAKEQSQQHANLSVEGEELTSALTKLNKEVSSKMLEYEFPWKELDEPVDIERALDVTLMDIALYENFIQQSVTEKEYFMKNERLFDSNICAITYNKEYERKTIKLLENQNNPAGPQLRDIYQALNTAKANSIVNLERLETLGDSFLKLTISLYIILKYPEYDEGQATALKGRIISNKNLFYLGRQKEISSYLINSDVIGESQWLPPCFVVPEIIRERILSKKMSIRVLYSFDIPLEDQISGVLEKATLEAMEEEHPVEENEERDYASMCSYLQGCYFGDKVVADTVEALLGAYFSSNGFEGGIKFIEWIGIIPRSEHLMQILNSPAPNPIINENSTRENIDFHIPNWQVLEKNLGYHFRNRAYLLQALTHSSYVSNRTTNCYQRLEFLGDAVLDFLITCHIYEACGHLSPGDITDLRSALVNNNTFASYSVRCGFHKFLLAINSTLSTYIDSFAEFQERRNHVIDDTVLILLQEGDLNLAEHVDVPKVLGDLFEALAGAVYLDSGKDLKTVWDVFYKIIWKEVDAFSQNVPKNTVRLLYEKQGVHPKFSDPIEVREGTTMVRLDFLLNGVRKAVHGFGDNKAFAKKAAAKIALRLLEADST